MFYARAIASFGLLSYKKIPQINRFMIYKSKPYSNLSAIMVEEYDYQKEIIEASTSEICGYCRGTQYVRCNLCRSGCVSCNFTEVMPCPFCNSRSENVSHIHTEYIKNKIPKPSFNRMPKNQYRVPF
tara:strand:+ start:1870 stop:2250 length:381 start_codon:yes stop_codon:yes gene_type:complete